MSTRPPRSRAGIGEWPVWGDEPPQLWFRQIASTPVRGAVVPQPQPRPQAPVAVARPASPPLSLPGLILGLLGAFLWWVPVVGLGCGLFGAVLSMQARRAIPPGYPGRATPTAGLVLGGIGIALGVIASAVLATVGLSALFSALYGS